MPCAKEQGRVAISCREQQNRKIRIVNLGQERKITIPPTKKIVALTYVVLNSLLKRMGVFAVEKREGKGSKIR